MSQLGDPNIFLFKFPTKYSRFVSHPKIRGRTEERNQGGKGIEFGDNWPGELKKTRRKKKRIGDESVKNAPKIGIKTVYFMY